jgi:hypothetical protein
VIEEYCFAACDRLRLGTLWVALNAPGTCATFRVFSSKAGILFWTDDAVKSVDLSKYSKMPNDEDRNAEAIRHTHAEVTSKISG